MQKTFASLIFLGLLAYPAGAEIRVMNYTGQDLKIDVLHQSGQARDIPIGKANFELSEPIGPMNPRHTSEMVVVKSTDGTELYREQVQSGEIMVIEKRASGYDLSHAAWFPGPAQHSTLSVMNPTGQNISYSYETPDFQLRQGKLESDPGSARAWNIGSENSFSIGQIMKVKFGVNSEPSEVHDLKAGSVYLLTLDGRTLKVREIGQD